MNNFMKWLTAGGAAALLSVVPVYAQGAPAGGNGMFLFLFLVLMLAFVILAVALRTYQIVLDYLTRKTQPAKPDYRKYLKNLTSKEIDSYLRSRKVPPPTKPLRSVGLLVVGLLVSHTVAFAQDQLPTADSLLGEKGIWITIVLLLIPIVGAIFFLIIKIVKGLQKYRTERNLIEAEGLASFLQTTEDEQLTETLIQRKAALDYRLTHRELSGTLAPDDSRGLIVNVDHDAALPIVARKMKANIRPKIDSELSRLIIWFIGTATFWLVFGTTIGEYLGIKFVAPDVDQISWLSFGRLRPVHTNAVFWGWSSLAMLGLGYYIVPRVGNAPLYSLKLGWYTLLLINVAVVAGTISLMAGINNGGGEYREYIWPIMLLFGIGLILTLINYVKTIAQRTTKEIYISNWYIVAAVIYGITIAVVAYVPLWQNGLGETIIQGYYMHQGVGMWFMLFTLGIVYYFLPQQLNKPIYSYSLGILAFWTQILFYTLIGTHHFVFSSIPWWLQTVAIVGSVGMVIPVVAGTTNFLLTFKGAWYKIPYSYTLPFFLVGIIFYFTGSLQGTAEAFRSTNLLWHFTDFTVAHSHITMYGIICFFLWAGIYAVMPRLTGQEPPQVTVGAHFWLALLGMLFYTVPLMYGSTLRGLMWIEGKPFIDSVVFMAPFWLWRAIGGSLMWLSHLFFAYNLYRMVAQSHDVDVKEAAFRKLTSEKISS